MLTDLPKDTLVVLDVDRLYRGLALRDTLLYAINRTENEQIRETARTIFHSPGDMRTSRYIENGQIISFNADSRVLRFEIKHKTIHMPYIRKKYRSEFFFPERVTWDSDIDDIIRRLHTYVHNGRVLELFKAADEYSSQYDENEGIIRSFEFSGGWFKAIVNFV